VVATNLGGAAGRSQRWLRGRCLGWGLVLWGWLLTTACGSASNSTGPIAGWAEGPVHWLMLPEEKRQCRRLRGQREAVLFIEFFWRRRDPTPTDPGNPFLQTFHDRVQAADKLYAEEGTRGALTDRGGALILLGAPPILRQRLRTVLSPPSVEDGGFGLDTPRPSEPKEETQILKDWEYPVTSLPPGLVRLLEQRGLLAAQNDDPDGVSSTPQALVLTFIEGETRTKLLEGEELLELAARAIATQPLG